MSYAKTGDLVAVELSGGMYRTTIALNGVPMEFWEFGTMLDALECASQLGAVHGIPEPNIYVTLAAMRLNADQLQRGNFDA